MCLSTRDRFPKSVMLRFVRSPEGEVVPDLMAKLPGRGMSVVADRKALEKAIAKGLFAKAAGEAVTVPDGLPERVESLLVRRCLGLLGQAKGAGALILGAVSVHSAARNGEAAAVIIASDGAPDGRRKTQQAVKAGSFISPDPEGAECLIVGCFSSAELSLALGRENVIHAALTKGGLADLFLSEIRRLQGFRALTPATWG